MTFEEIRTNMVSLHELPKRALDKKAKNKVAIKHDSPLRLISVMLDAHERRPL